MSNSFPFRFVGREDENGRFVAGRTWAEHERGHAIAGKDFARNDDALHESKRVGIERREGARHFFLRVVAVKDITMVGSCVGTVVH